MSPTMIAALKRTQQYHALICPDCKGRGSSEYLFCLTCNGTGKILIPDLSAQRSWRHSPVLFWLIAGAVLVGSLILILR